MLAANAHLAPGYSSGIVGIARSMPTSAAADSVAAKLGIQMYETPTGWKFFGNLLMPPGPPSAARRAPAPARTMCARRTGCGPVLLWLNILAARKQSVDAIVRDHWQIYGRKLLHAPRLRGGRRAKANQLVDDLRAKLPGLLGQHFGDLEVAYADDFTYNDPVDGSVSGKQGIRIGFADGSRIVLRLSGTGTVGATLRLYLERYEPASGDHDLDTQAALQPLVALAEQLAEIRQRTGRDAPTVIT